MTDATIFLIYVASINFATFPHIDISLKKANSKSILILRKNERHYIFCNKSLQKNTILYSGVKVLQPYKQIQKSDLEINFDMNFKQMLFSTKENVAAMQSLIVNLILNLKKLNANFVFNIEKKIESSDFKRILDFCSTITRKSNAFKTEVKFLNVVPRSMLVSALTKKDANGDIYDLTQKVMISALFRSTVNFIANPLDVELKKKIDKLLIWNLLFCKKLFFTFSVLEINAAVIVRFALQATARNANVEILKTILLNIRKTPKTFQSDQECFFKTSKLFLRPILLSHISAPIRDLLRAFTAASLFKVNRNQEIFNPHAYLSLINPLNFLPAVKKKQFVKTLQNFGLNTQTTSAFTPLSKTEVLSVDIQIRTKKDAKLRKQISNLNKIVATQKKRLQERMVQEKKIILSKESKEEKQINCILNDILKLQTILHKMLQLVNFDVSKFKNYSIQNYQQNTADNNVRVLTQSYCIQKEIARKKYKMSNFVEYNNNINFLLAEKIKNKTKFQKSKYRILKAYIAFGNFCSNEFKFYYNFRGSLTKLQLLESKITYPPNISNQMQIAFNIKKLQILLLNSNSLNNAAKLWGGPLEFKSKKSKKKIEQFLKKRQNRRILIVNNLVIAVRKEFKIKFRRNAFGVDAVDTNLDIDAYNLLDVDNKSVESNLAESILKNNKNQKIGINYGANSLFSCSFNVENNPLSILYQNKKAIGLQSACLFFYQYINAKYYKSVSSFLLSKKLINDKMMAALAQDAKYAEKNMIGITTEVKDLVTKYNATINKIKAKKKQVQLFLGDRTKNRRALSQANRDIKRFERELRKIKYEQNVGESCLKRLSEIDNLFQNKTQSNFVETQEKSNILLISGTNSNLPDSRDFEMQGKKTRITVAAQREIFFGLHGVVGIYKHDVLKRVNKAKLFEFEINCEFDTNESKNNCQIIGSTLKQLLELQEDMQNLSLSSLSKYKARCFAINSCNESIYSLLYTTLDKYSNVSCALPTEFQRLCAFAQSNVRMHEMDSNLKLMCAEASTSYLRNIGKIKKNFNLYKSIKNNNDEKLVRTLRNISRRNLILDEVNFDRALSIKNGENSLANRCDKKSNEITKKKISQYKFLSPLFLCVLNANFIEAADLLSLNTSINDLLLSSSMQTICCDFLCSVQFGQANISNNNETDSLQHFHICQDLTLSNCLALKSEIFVHHYIEDVQKFTAFENEQDEFVHFFEFDLRKKLSPFQQRVFLQTFQGQNDKKLVRYESNVEKSILDCMRSKKNPLAVGLMIRKLEQRVESSMAVADASARVAQIESVKNRFLQICQYYYEKKNTELCYFANYSTSKPKHIGLFVPPANQMQTSLKNNFVYSDVSLYFANCLYTYTNNLNFGQLLAELRKTLDISNFPVKLRANLCFFPSMESKSLHFFNHVVGVPGLALFVDKLAQDSVLPMSETMQQRYISQYCFALYVQRHARELGNRLELELLNAIELFDLDMQGILKYCRNNFRREQLYSVCLLHANDNALKKTNLDAFFCDQASLEIISEIAKRVPVLFAHAHKLSIAATETLERTQNLHPRVSANLVELCLKKTKSGTFSMKHIRHAISRQLHDICKKNDIQYNQKEIFDPNRSKQTQNAIFYSGSDKKKLRFICQAYVARKTLTLINKIERKELFDTKEIELLRIRNTSDQKKALARVLKSKNNKIYVSEALQLLSSGKFEGEKTRLAPMSKAFSRSFFGVQHQLHRDLVKPKYFL